MVQWPRIQTPKAGGPGLIPGQRTRSHVLKLRKIPTAHCDADQRSHVLQLDNCERRSVVSSSLRSHGLYSPWNSPGQNTGVGSLFLLQLRQIRKQVNIFSEVDSKRDPCTLHSALSIITVCAWLTHFSPTSCPLPHYYYCCRYF